MTLSLPHHYREILKGLGEDPEREGLLDTPKRAAKAMQYLCHGYEQNLEEIVNGALFASDNDEMVILKDIELYSLCEHHLLPFIGKAHVAYIPTGKSAGPVEAGAHRRHVRAAPADPGKPHAANRRRHPGRDPGLRRGGGDRSQAHVHDDARRGKQNSTMNTSVMLGAFRESNTTRMEFLQLIGRSK